MIIILGGGFIGAQLHSFLNNKYFNIKLVTKSDVDYSNEKILTDFLLANKPRFGTLVIPMWIVVKQTVKLV